MHSSTHSLTSVLDGGEWPASHSGHFTPREKAPGTPWIQVNKQLINGSTDHVKGKSKVVPVIF